MNKDISLMTQKNYGWNHRTSM